MTKNVKIGLIVLVVLAGIYYLNIASQNKYSSSYTNLFPEDTDGIHKIVIQKGEKSIELILVDTTWNITGYDSLIIKKRSIDNLFNRVLTVTKGTVISKNPEKWLKYSVDDSTGTHLTIYDDTDKEIGSYVFGRSKSDYSRNYVRTGEDPTVYLTDQNILYYLNAQSTYWGEKPKPVETEEDTTSLD